MTSGGHARSGSRVRLVLAFSEAPSAMASRYVAEVVKPAARLCGEAGLDYAPTRLADSLFLNLLRKEPIEPDLVDCLQANLKPVDVLL